MAVLLAALCAPALSAQGFLAERLPSDLKGTWEIFLGETPTAGGWQPVAVPGPWEDGPAPGFDGHAWYRTRIWLPGRETGPVLGLWFDRIRDADEVFLNGRRVGGTGRFPPDFEKATLYSRTYALPPQAIRAGRWNEVTVHVFNHARSGGIVGRPPRLDTYDNLVAARHREAGIILVLVTFLLVVSANHVFMFLYRPETRVNLLFGVFSVVTALYLLTFSPTLGPAALSMNVLFRLNVVLFTMSVGLLLWFLFASFENRLRRPVRVLLGLLVVVAVLEAVWPNLAQLYAGVWMTELLSLLVVVALARLMTRAVRRRTPYALSVAVALVPLVLAALYDIGVDLGLFVRPRVAVAGMAYPLGLIPFYVVMGLTLAHQYARYYVASVTDRLTGLMERHHFLGRLDTEIERARRDRAIVVVAMLDLDDFKEINDRYTHLAGDRVLRDVAWVVRRELRSFDLVGRYGGDELCVGLVVHRREEAEQLLERLRRAVRDGSTEFRDENLSVTVSVGAAACHPGGRIEAGRILESADHALFVVKAAGGDAVNLVDCGEPSSGRRVAVV